MSVARTIRAMALGCGLLWGGVAFAQGDVPPPTQDGPAEPELHGPSCPGGCPLCEAHHEATRVLENGATVTMEETPNGAVLRFEGPPGDPETIEAARAAAQAYTRALQAPATGRDCPCPRDEGGACPHQGGQTEDDMENGEEEIYP